MSDIRIKMAKDLRDMSDMVGDLHWMAAKAVEDLIKKDARIAELENAAESLRVSRDYHHDQAVEYRRRWAGLNAAPVQQVSAIQKGAILVGRSELALVRNALLLDCEQGRPVRGEMLAMLDASIEKFDRLAAAPAAPAADAAQAYEIGIYGKAYDLPSKRRAYTYDEQPDNVGAYKLAKALVATGRDSHGDGIDQGLSLLNRLQEAGFGVFELAAAPAPGGE